MQDDERVLYALIRAPGQVELTNLARKSVPERTLALLEPTESDEREPLHLRVADSIALTAHQHLAFVSILRRIGLPVSSAPLDAEDSFRTEGAVSFRVPACSGYAGQREGGPKDFPF